MTMPLYPTTPVPDTPYNTQDTFRTLSSPEFDSGKQVYKSLRNYPLFSANLTYGNHSTWSDLSSLYAFFVDCKGSATAFDFIDFNGHDKSPVGIQWPKLYIAVATGSTQTYEVPMKGSSGYLLYDNGTDITNNLWTSGAFNNPMWKFHAAAGANGRDTIEFHTAPTAGHILEWKAVGQRVVTAHFTTDNIGFSSFTNMLASTGLAIKEVR